MVGSLNLSLKKSKVYSPIQQSIILQKTWTVMQKLLQALTSHNCLDSTEDNLTYDESEMLRFKDIHKGESCIIIEMAHRLITMTLMQVFLEIFLHLQ